MFLPIMPEDEAAFRCISIAAAAAKNCKNVLIKRHEH